MSDAVNTEIDDKSVANYLADNPDFFSNKNSLLLKMKIPHDSGSAISLIERQMNLLRQQNSEQQQNIQDFITNAQANDLVFTKIREVILKILETENLQSLTNLIEEQIKQDFDASISQLIFITDSPDDAQTFSQNIISTVQSQEFLGDIVARSSSFCGDINHKQKDLLFTRTTEQIVSAAIIPIPVKQSAKVKQLLGNPALVIGSTHENHFHADLDTLFLDFISEILAVHLAELSIESES